MTNIFCYLGVFLGDTLTRSSPKKERTMKEQQSTVEVTTVKRHRTGRAMRKQKKINSLIETMTNTVVGLLLSFCIQIIIYPALGIKVTIGENVTITFVFFLVSILRGYIIRRIFNHYGTRSRTKN